MLVIKVCMWPHGDPEKERLLCVGRIANDGTGTKEYGNYEVDLTGSGRNIKKVWRSGHVTGQHRQRLHVWHLVHRALCAAIDGPDI